ncbi:UNVERIFIED_CONTAM: hypothetical protein GTU68_059878 [Idotea baltica]|nr:hypothetical protein [Idotea baltica]
MNQMQEQQQVVQEKLKELRIQETSADGIVSVTFNGEHEVLDLKVDWGRVEDHDMVEDLLIAVMNSANTKIAAATADITKNSLSGILPPGLSNLI